MTAKSGHPSATPSPAPSVPAFNSMTDLSRGAPPGAKTIPAQPVHVAKPAPATPAAVSALAANGIPAVALNAYRVAAARMASADPSCGIQWPLLAAIGRVESDHGQYGGATLLANGTSSIPIIGPALDGKTWDYVADTDGGRLDGDPVYDHAVGPMQFIPSTWAEYGVDANGDGSASPFDINDAALAAARYLCAAGGNLRTLAGEEQAVLAYNHSDQYLALVLATAAAYAAGVPVTAPISGITSGSLPAPGGTFIPPVNPGAVIAAPGGSTPPSGPPSSHTTAPRRAHSGGSGSGSGSGGSAGTSGGSGTGGTGTGSGSGGSGSGSGGSGGGSTPGAGPVPLPTLSGPPVPLPSLPVGPAPLPTPSSPGNVVGTALCTVTSVLGSLVPVPCPTH